MIITPSLSANGALSAGTERSTKLGKNEFLTLLITQLRNQDPMSPLEPHEFAAQLAQFTSVEQLTLLNDQMTRQADGIDLNALLGKTNLSAGLIGKTVLAEGDQVIVPSSGGAKVTVDVGAGGGKGTMVIKDSTGKEVARRELGTVSSGRQTFEIPKSLEPGRYTYEVNVVGPKDSKIDVATYVSGRVDGVTFKNGQIHLKIGSIEVALDALAEIEASPTSATDPTTAIPTPPAPTDPWTGGGVADLIAKLHPRS